MPRLKKTEDAAPLTNEDHEKVTEPKKRGRKKTEQTELSGKKTENKTESPVSVDKKSENNTELESTGQVKTIKKRTYTRRINKKNEPEATEAKNEIKDNEPKEVIESDITESVASASYVSENTPSDSMAISLTVDKNEREKHAKPRYSFNNLSVLLKAELLKIAEEFSVSATERIRKDDLILEILRSQAESMGYKFGGGTLECLPDGYGFLRPNGLLPSLHDIYVSTSQIRRFGLRNGDVVWGIIRPPRGEQEHYGALLRVETVNFSNPEFARRRPFFENLTPIFPDEQLVLETDKSLISTRMVDLFAPIGKGQRALVVAPPKVGKTTLIKNIANAITTNNPDTILMVLLIDERPEEVTDMSRSVQGEVIASTFDRPAEEHMRVASLALEKAKRLVEVSKDVVLLLDSITRLARASNLVVPPSGRTLSGGMDPSALNFPKKFFGAARNIENGGSLTIIGTSLVETGSRMDDVIYEEFKGTGNMEIHLSRKLSEMRIFPAIDVIKSGTRKEELLLKKEDMFRIWSLRRRISNMDETDVTNSIIAKLRDTNSNGEFLTTIKV